MSFAARLLYGEKSPKTSRARGETLSFERMIGPGEVRDEKKAREAELRRMYRDAEKALKKTRRWIQKGLFGEVNGCSVCLRRKDGMVVSPLRYLVEIHVPRKFAEDRLGRFNPDRKSKRRPSRPQRIPDSVDGVPIKVVEAAPYRTSGVARSGNVKVKGNAELQDITVTSIDLANTEIVGGLPIDKRDQGDWGTLGITFSNRKDEEAAATIRYFGLANAHFAPDSGVMVQPSASPSDQTLWEIGTVKVSLEADDADGYYVDAALIELNQKRDVITRQIHQFENEKMLFASRPLNGFDDDEIKVFKFGARTARRLEGTVKDPVFTDLQLPGVPGQLGLVIDAQGVGQHAFTETGDSGSALVAPVYDPVSGTERLLVVGICFAGLQTHPRTVYACHFSQVLKALNLTIPKSFLRDHWLYQRP